MDRGCHAQKQGVTQQNFGRDSINHLYSMAYGVLSRCHACHVQKTGLGCYVRGIRHVTKLERERDYISIIIIIIIRGSCNPSVTPSWHPPPIFRRDRRDGRDKICNLLSRKELFCHVLHPLSVTLKTGRDRMVTGTRGIER